jgi:hypothetical protein
MSAKHVKMPENANPFEPPIANKAAHNRAVLLLDKSLVILAIRPGPGEFNAVRRAIRLDRLVDEDAVIVGINPRMGNGNPALSRSSAAATIC